MEKAVQKTPYLFVAIGAALVVYSSWTSMFSSEVATTNTAKAILNIVKKNQETQTSAESLKKAYTGNWFKNSPLEHESASTFQFAPPMNTRNGVEDSSAKKKADANKQKKKQTKKKSIKAFKTAKMKSQRRWKGLFDKNEFGQNRNISNFIYYPYGQKPQNTQTTIDPDQKKWTADELLTIVQETKSISELVNLYKTGKISSIIFYNVVDKIFNTNDDSIRKLAYQALSETPSLASFSNHAEFLNSESSEEIKIFANELLAVYKQITYTSILNQGLSFKEKTVQILAATYLLSVVDYIHQNGSTDEDRTPSSVITELQLQKYKNILNQSIQIMTLQLSKGQLDSETVTAYQQSMAHIQNYLNSFLAEQNIASF